MSDITELQQIDFHGGQIGKPSWTLNGRFIAVPTESGSIFILDTQTMQVVQTLGPHSGAVTAVGWNREGDFIVSGSLDRSIGIWEVKNGRRVGIVIAGHKEPLHSMEYTNEGAFAMTCSSDHVRALDGYCLETGWTREMEDSVNGYGGFTAASCSFNTTLLLALAAKDGTLLALINLLDAEVISKVPMKEPVRCLAWSRADTFLAVATDRGIVTLAAKLEQGFIGSPRQLADNLSLVQAVAFSSDGKLLASRDAQGLKVWSVKTENLISKLDDTEPLPAGRAVSTIAFHPSKPLLAAVTSSGTALRILDLSKLV
jgi:WD40 repeat protein